MAKNKEEVSIPAAETGELGALLKGLRDKIGYTIPQTADAMCLSEHTIRQLENEEFDSLPEPPYIRGYLRNYAKLAETDSEGLINCYESLRGADPSDLQQHHFKRSSIINSQQKKGLSPVLLQLFFLALLLGLLAAASMVPAVNQWIKSTWDSFSNQTTSQSESATDNPLLTGTMPVPTPLPSDINAEKNKAPQEKPSSALAEQPSQEKPATNDNKNGSKQVVAGEKKSTTANTKDESNIKVGEENKDEAQIPSSSDGIIKIKLVFNKEVWMRIKDGNKKTVFEGQNRSGQEKALELKKPLTFRVGNAQGLSLFVNGKAVDIKRYTKGSVANFTLE